MANTGKKGPFTKRNYQTSWLTKAYTEEQDVDRWQIEDNEMPTSDRLKNTMAHGLYTGKKMLKNP